MAIVITTAQSPEQIAKAIRKMLESMAGRGPLSHKARSVMKAVGVEAMTIIRDAFIKKSFGNADDASIKWKPLSPYTIAYRRRHPRLQAQRKRAAKANRSARPLLTKPMDQLWRAVYASSLARGMTPANAAAKAWILVKAAGGKTILGQYGNISVLIGRDTGRLLNSLVPAHKEAILKVQPGSVSVGSNVEYAAAFHKERPMWPGDTVVSTVTGNITNISAGGSWPEVWNERLTQVLFDAILRVFRLGVIP